jgi:hypothetical protein
MIQLKAALADGRVLIVLGLSRENIRRLQDGQPIHVDPEVLLGVQPGERIGAIMLFAGETEASMAQMLTEGGLIGQQTTVHTVPRPPKGKQ